MEQPGDDGTGRTNHSRFGGGSLGRRHFLAAAGAATATGLAGCGGLLGDGGEGEDGGDGQALPGGVELAAFRGSGPLVEDRGAPGGTSITELPDLEGELNFYLSFGEGGLYLQLIDLFEQIYPDFTTNHTQDSSGGLANRIIQETEAGTSPADVFIAVDAGALGTVAQAGATRALPDSVTETVPSSLRTDQWVGIAGRARAVPYNADQISESDVPDSIQEFPETAAFQDSFGWAPTYSAFQAFITAMRILEGEETTRSWLNGMQDAGVQQFGNEFIVSDQAASGAITAGLANHYYSLRVRSQRPNAPIELAFTSGDAGALINVSGAEIIQGTQNAELAENFLRHLVSAEAQEFFATRTFAYPTIPGVQPVGGLPTIDELNPPDLDLAELADTDATIDLLRDTGVL
jgi:iron(III) transport system substrate-binding protein